MKIIKTNLIITCTCKQCGATYFASLIYGGVELDKEATTTIAEAENKGDKVELTRNPKGVWMQQCNC